MARLLSILLLSLLLYIPLIADDGDSENIDLVSMMNFWAAPCDIETYGDYAYIGMNGSGFRILDISNPDTPLEVNKVFDLTTQKLFINGSYLYSVCDATISIFDLDNPVQPVFITDFMCDGEIKNIGFFDDYLAIAQDYVNIKFYDFSDILNPEFVSEISSFSPIFDIRNDYLYYASPGGGIYTIDISNPVNPTSVGRFFDDLYFDDMVISGDYGYLAGGNGIVVFDLSDPTDPEITSNIYTYYWDHIGVNNQTLYAYNGPSGVFLYDISDPGNPDYLCSFGSNPSAVHIKDNILYYSDLDERLDIYDISQPDNLEVLNSEFKSQILCKAALRGDYLIATDLKNGLVSIDISDPQNPELFKAEELLPCQGEIFLVDNYAYFNSENSGIVCYDISNPESPEHIGSHLPISLYKAQKHGDYVYLSIQNYLFVYDFSDPLNPTQIETLDRMSSSFTIDSNDILYHADYNTFYAYDISDLASPQLIGQYNYIFTSDDCEVVICNETALIKAENDLTILDITDLENIFMLGRIHFNQNIRSIETDGTHVCLAFRGEGIKLLDVSNPQEIVISGYYDSYGNTYDCVMNDGLLYLISGTEFEILDFSGSSGTTENIEELIPNDFAISKVYPNPFNPSMEIEITVPKSTHLQLNVFNINGQKIRTLADHRIAPGVYSYTFNGSELASGNYFVKASFGETTEVVKRITLMK